MSFLLSFLLFIYLLRNIALILTLTNKQDMNELALESSVVIVNYNCNTKSTFPTLLFKTRKL